jgi:cysteine desulfurase
MSNPTLNTGATGRGDRPGRVYLDHAASTPMYPEAVAAMTEQLTRPGNPSSLHASGRAARRVVEESRETIARALNARPGEVVFTSGGTESDNLAVKGLYWARRGEDPRRNRVLSTAVEHHAVLDSVHWLEEQGADVELLPVNRCGRLETSTLREAIERDPESVALVSVMWANNEVGTIQPVAEVARIAHEFDIPVHTDAVQAVGQVEVDFTASGVDALTLTAHKIGGPVGVGALVVRRDIALTPLLHGGGQERDVRSGTLDAPAIRGFAAAVELAVKREPETASRLAGLRDDLLRRVADVVPDVVLSGDRNCAPTNRLPGNAHIQFPGCEGDSLLMLLDARGIECSTGSACSAGVPQPSHVLLAMGADEVAARSALRFSLGHTTTPADVDALVESIGPVVERARAAGVASGLGLGSTAKAG